MSYIIIIQNIKELIKRYPVTFIFQKELPEKCESKEEQK
jgi:hypothetical protein